MAIRKIHPLLAQPPEIGRFLRGDGIGPQSVDDQHQIKASLAGQHRANRDEERRIIEEAEALTAAGGKPDEKSPAPAA